MSAGYLRACARKEREPDKSAALVARKALAGRHGLSKDQFRAYRCIQCGAWHVGRARFKNITGERRKGRRSR